MTEQIRRHITFIVADDDPTILDINVRNIKTLMQDDYGIKEIDASLPPSYKGPTYEIIMTHDGKETIQALLEFDANYKEGYELVMVLDYMMPQFSGVDVHTAARTGSHPRLHEIVRGHEFASKSFEHFARILFHTAYGQDFDKENFVKIGDIGPASLGFSQVQNNTYPDRNTFLVKKPNNIIAPIVYLMHDMGFESHTGKAYDEFGWYHPNAAANSDR